VDDRGVDRRRDHRLASPRILAESVDASLVCLAAKSVGILAIVVLLFRFAENIGIPVYGLVTGAGVGGLAIALAARSTLENFMGALSLFTDRPVSVGDRCRYDEDQSGEWRSVGRVDSLVLSLGEPQADTWTGGRMARKQTANSVSPLRLGVAALLAGALVGVLGGAFLLTLR
jgi:hypothetical protein